MSLIPESTRALRSAAGYGPVRQRARRVWVLVVMLLSIVPSFLAESASPRDSKPYTINRIIIHRREIFGRRAGWLGSVANDLHVLTRESVIREELLFDAGDEYDPDLLDETERNLRALGIIGDVAVVADTLQGRKINVHVYTHDRWTLGLKPAFKQEGGVRDMRLQLNDDNLLGYGQSATIGYDYRSDRDHPHGFELDFVDRRLFGSRVGINAQYHNSEDNILRSINLERPFFSEATRWAGGLTIMNGRERLRVYNNGDLVHQEFRKQETENGWAARSFGGFTKYRLGGAFIRARAERGGLPLSSTDNMDLLVGSLSVNERRFYKGRYVENFGRVEDIPVGYVFTMLAGPNFGVSRAAVAGTYMRVDGQYAFGVDRLWYANTHMSVSGFVSGGATTDGFFEQEITGYWRTAPVTTLVWRLNYTRGINWSEGRQLLLGSPTGLRGYEATEFSGQQQLLLNIQYRIFAPVSLWIFRVGGSLFLDSGTAWAADAPLAKQQVHSSVGFGFMIENSAQQGSGLIRIDVPFNLDKRRFTEVIISSDQLFKAFTDLGFLPPTSVR